MRKLYKVLRDKKTVSALVEKIKKLDLGRVNIMEVCGTHTYTFFRFGLRTLLYPYVNLISGPGCPVCITENSYIDKSIHLAKHRKNIITTFGDLLKVRGTSSSLYEEKAKGANVMVVYSPYQVLDIARKYKDKYVVMLAIGFETTAPLVASVILEAKRKNVKNIFFLIGHRLIPPAMEAICQDKDLNIEGFICPGHVSAIIGTDVYQPIVKKYKKGCVVCGFEPVDMVMGIYILLSQIKNRKPAVENEYERVVKPQGNKRAMDIMNKVFKVEDAGWRGLGIIEKSGLSLKEDYKNFDACNLLDSKVISSMDSLPESCICGEVIKGKREPTDCRYFGKICNPSNPLGPCMVSFEGTCRIYFVYGQDPKLLKTIV